MRIRVTFVAMRSMQKRFWSKVQRGRPTQCWPWQAGRFPAGYGQFRVAMGESPRKAHRVAWELANGPIPDGAWVLHSCDNPPCCNPAHLFLGTPADNVADMIAKGRACWTGNQRSGTRSSRAKLTAAEVRKVRRLHGKGWSQRRIATEVGIHQSNVHRLVNGKQYATE